MRSSGSLPSVPCELSATKSSDLSRGNPLLQWSGTCPSAQVPVVFDQSVLSQESRSARRSSPHGKLFFSVLGNEAPPHQRDFVVPVNELESLNAVVGTIGITTRWIVGGQQSRLPLRVRM